ncbi:sigma-70 family RNA polymerase sigma factor [bacterium]|nr:MAG: sigma-70 family RNA polymerase sigma factor [bacterium]
MLEQDNTFVAGVLKTLQSVSMAALSNSGLESVYHEIVNQNDIEILCRVARSYGWLEKSGLATFGYAVSHEDACSLEKLKEFSHEERRDRERRIIASAQKGDDLAKTLLLRDYEVVINTVLRRKFGWFLTDRDRHLSRDDLRQEAIYAVLKCLQAYDPSREDASFRALVEIVMVSHLHRIICQREAIVSYPTKAYRERTANILFSTESSVDDEGDDLIEKIPDEFGHLNMVELFEKSEFRAHVESLMCFLPDKEHFMIRIYFGFDGEPLSKSAIAKDRGQSVAAVTVILESALNLLRYWMISGKTPKRSRKLNLIAVPIKM